MARLPRLEWPGQTHYLLQRTHGSPALAAPGPVSAGRPQPLCAFNDAADRSLFLAALREAAAAERVQVHAYALLPTELHLLATPDAAGNPGALGRLMQALGRRYVSAYNRRYAHRGGLWEGRFRCAVVEPGATRLQALLLIDGQADNPGWTSASSRTGGAREGLLVDPPEWWALGNTPFDREALYRQQLANGLPPAQAEVLRRAVLGGWAAGSAAFAASVAEATARPARPRARGRPRKTAPAG